jgi:type IX secretion system PorP/SprF family membrane protein
MKHFLTILIISSCIFSFGQTDMFWNNYANFNPAMSAFQYKQHGALSVIESSYGSKGLDGVHFNYNLRLKDQHGIGITYTGSYPFYMTNVVSGNYNYQFDLKKASRLSLGVSAGAGRGQYTDEVDPLFIPNSAPRNFLYTNIGTAYSWKKLVVGISTSNLFPTEDPSWSTYPYRIGMNAHASYDFELGENFELTPRMLFTTYDGFHNLRFNLTSTYKNKFVLGLLIANRSTAGVNIGLNLKEKFHFAYAYSATFSKLNNALNFGNHEFVIGYFLK